MHQLCGLSLGRKQSNVRNVAHDGNCAIPVIGNGGAILTNMNGQYTGCAAAGGPNALYFTRSTTPGSSYIDVPSSKTQSAWTTPGSLNINGIDGTAVASDPGWEHQGLDWYYSQIIIDRAQTQFWLALPYVPGIAYSASAAILPRTVGTGYLLNGLVPSGLALSPDETILYFSVGPTVYWILSTFAANGMSMATGGSFSTLQPNVLVTLSTPFFEFRGIALAPQTCASPGYYCASSGALPALPCVAGSFCAGNGTSLAPCSPGFDCP